MTAVLNNKQIEDLLVLSDRELYSEAIGFARQHCMDSAPRNAQLNGLLQYSQNWKDWKRFVEHQSKRTEHADKEFYQALLKWTNALPKKLSEWKLVQEEGTKAERQAEIELVGNVVVREFAQHLACELLSRQEG